MSDRLTGTSNGGATTHAFGVKVQGPDAYGRDRGRDILALSGYPGSFLITAANSDGSGIQLLNLTFEDPIPNAPTIGVNSFFNEMGEVEDFRVATDGIEGANTRAFLAEFDAQLPFRPFPNDATDVEPVPDVPLVFSIAFDSIFNAKTFPSGLLTFGPGVIISIYESSVHRPVNWRPHHIFKIYLSDLNPENDRRQAWPDV